MIDNLKEYFKNNYNDLYVKMVECDHGHGDGRLNPYHEEGDVWTHTEMVLDAIEDKSNVDVVVAALLHDIGKPFVREVKGEKVRFFGHAGVSTFYAIDIINDIKKNVAGFEKIDITMILNMINIHDILFISRANVSAKNLAEKLAGYGSIFVKNLIMLSRADNDGRICKNRNDEIEFNDYASEVSARVLVYDLIKTYDSNNFRIFKENSAIMLVGLPYSGKSTAIKNTKGIEDHKVISRDDVIMSLADDGMSYHDAWGKVNHQTVNRIFDRQLRDALNHSENVIIDMTNLSPKVRNGKLNMMPGTYRKVAWVFYTGLNEMKNRIAKRTEKIIGQNVLDDMMKRYTIPMFDEFDSIFFVYDNGSVQVVNNF